MEAKARRITGLLIGFVLLSSLTHRACAQTPGPFAEWYYSQGHLLEVYARGELPHWERTLGIAAETQPKYEGDNAYTTSGGPAFDIRYRDIAFASSGEGIGVNLLRDKRYRAGVALAYDMGRNVHDDHHLTGLQNYGPAPEAKLFAEYIVVFPLTLRVDARHTFGGQGGWIGDVSLYSPLAGSERYYVFAGPSVTFADANNMRHTFGVSELQSANSGYPAYDAGSGLRSASFVVSGGYFPKKRWLIEGAISAEKLLGGAGDSPFVQERSQFCLAVSTAYRW